MMSKRGGEMMDIYIRRAIKDDITSIANGHADSWKTTYKGIFPDEFLENITYEKREKQWEDIFQKEGNHQFRFVAENLNGEIVGFIDGGVERTGTYNCDGELYAIYLLQEYQGMKIGQKLFQALLLECINNEMQSLLVWVVTNILLKSFMKNLIQRKLIQNF